MTRYVAWAFAALLLIPATGSAKGLCDKGQSQGKSGSAQQSGHQFPKWWVEPKSRAELNITEKQSALIDAAWKKDYQRRAEGRKKLAELEEKLDQMMLAASADEAAVAALLDKVEAARSEANKARALVLYQIYKLLTPEQRAKLDAKAKEMRGQRGGGDGRRDRQ